jgi:hypothetical protein
MGAHRKRPCNNVRGQGAVEPDKVASMAGCCCCCSCIVPGRLLYVLACWLSNGKGLAVAEGAAT